MNILLLFFSFLETEKEREQGEGQRGRERERKGILSRFHAQCRAHRARSQDPEIMT